MTNSRADHPLEHWLLLLVAPSEQDRHRAGKALEMACWGHDISGSDNNAANDDTNALPGESPPALDFEQRPRQFAADVRSVLSHPSFDAPSYVERLVAYLLSLQSDWRRRIDEQNAATELRDARFERLADKLQRGLPAGPHQVSEQLADGALAGLARLARLSAAYIGSAFRDNAPLEGAELMSPAGIMAQQVFEVLSLELIETDELLPLCLADSGLRSHALRAIERLAPTMADADMLEKLASLGALLLGELDRTTTRNHFDAAVALGAIARRDPTLVTALSQRLTHRRPAIRAAAASALRHAAPLGAEVRRDLCQRLLQLLDEPDTWHAGAEALACIGAADASVRARFIELSQPGDEGLMWQRGYALSLLGHFRDHAAECLPALIEAMESFKEFDPDECYAGPLGRVAQALEQLGPAAAEAAEPLARHLEDEPDELPRAILDALAAIGPGASAALPALEQLRSRCQDYEDDVEIDDRWDDPIGWTIQQIRRPEPP
ncbi:MAG: hypothetical protein KDB14_17280 [Planctomycetales bacterium]|nr:hypothetical protein [Planctomycetales bacterium]